MRNLDFKPFYRTAIGFDSLFDDLVGNITKLDDTSYPPFNIEKISDTDYRISLAIAGFKDDEITIETKDNSLTISGEKIMTSSNSESSEFIHQGIATRSFQKTFRLADNIKVKDANLEHGLLHVEMVREIPETEKPRIIKINNKSKK